MKYNKTNTVSPNLAKAFYIFATTVVVVPFLPDQLQKLVYGAMLWLGYLFMYLSKDKTYVTKCGRLLVNIMLFLVTLLFVRVFIYDEIVHFTGNVWLTVFGSYHMGVLLYMMPLLIVFARPGIILKSKTAINYLILFVFITVPLFFAIIGGKGEYPLSVIGGMLFCLPYIYYSSKKQKFIYSLALIFILVYSYQMDERALTMFLVTSIFTSILVWINVSTKLLKIYTIVCMVVLVAILVYSLVYGISVFSLLQEMYADQTDVVHDTRSFIFYEISSDFNKDHHWLFGKGMLGVCYSPYFDASKSNEADSAYRIGLEVGALQYMLKGGITYFVSFATIILYSVFYAINNSKNKMAKVMAMILVNNLFLTCVSQGPTFDIRNLFLWLLIGFCMSPIIINLHDDDIKQIAFTKHHGKI